MANLIKKVTKRRLRIVPDSSRNYVAENSRAEREFEIQVVNTSSVFASFQVELSIEGVDPTSKIQWYSVEPEICSKKPPGDGTKFSVVLNKAPVSTYETTIPIRLNVFSVDSEALFDAQTLELSIEQPKRPLRVYLPLKDLKVYPGDKLDIPVLVYNLSPKFTQITLRLNELDADWFVQKEVVKTLRIDAGDSQEVTFCCSPPRRTQTRSQVYPFTVEAEDQDQNIASHSGEIEVLPYGVLKFECPEPIQLIPRSRQPQDKDGRVAHYPLELANNSNLKQRITLNLLESGQPIHLLEPLPPLEIEPGAIAIVTQAVSKPRPWLGWQRSYRFEAIPVLTNAHSGESSEPVYADPNVRTLDLKVRPLIPFWLQLLCALLALLGLGTNWWVTAPKSPHEAPVNSVRIIGNETTVVSGSSDEKVWRWDASPLSWIVNSRRLSPREAIAPDTQRAVRVIREIPQREGQIAVGLENGEIQIWRVSPPQQQAQAPIFERSDRVFDLDFSPDSRYLFSGHGSGFVRQWRRSGSGYSLAKELSLGSAISALSVIDLSDGGQPDQSVVAIAGQYNQFVLWDWQNNRRYPVTYRWNQLNASSETPVIQPVISKYDYINSVAVARNASILAMSDNRGFITLWNVADLSECTRAANSSACNNVPILDQWQASSDGQSVRSVALSDDGCYLASTGDNGEVKLWMIKDGDRDPNEPPNSETIAKFPDIALRAVDIKHPASNYVLVAFNAQENQVRLYRQPVNDSKFCSP